jgi:hypothetical protein
MVDEAESHLKGNGRPLGVSLSHGWKSKAVNNTGKTIATGTASPMTKTTMTKATKKTGRSTATGTADPATYSTVVNGQGVRIAVKRTRITTVLRWEC